jgi:hypothetical protein
MYRRRVTDQHRPISANFAFGSFSEVGARNRHVRFPPDSDQTADIAGGPVRANCGLIHRSKRLLDSITSSALESRLCGTLRPSSFALFRFITSSNLVGALDRKLARFRAPQNSINKVGRSPEHVAEIDAGCRPWTQGMHRHCLTKSCLTKSIWQVRPLTRSALPRDSKKRPAKGNETLVPGGI